MPVGLAGLEPAFIAIRYDVIRSARQTHDFVGSRIDIIARNQHTILYHKMMLAG
jgi:hypothetical protein